MQSRKNCVKFPAITMHFKEENKQKIEFLLMQASHDFTSIEYFIDMHDSIKSMLLIL